MIRRVVLPYVRVLTEKEKAALTGEVFLGSHFEGVDLSGSDLRNTRFERVTIVSCNLSGADLRGARFVHCELRSVVLTGALLGDNRFDGTTFVESDGLTAEALAQIEQSGGSFQQARASDR